MKLYFLRHAEASYDAPSDAERALTGRGERRTRIAASVIDRLGVRPDVIYSSPRRRAYQTAAIVAKKLGMEVTIDHGLDYDFDVDVVARLIAGLDEDAELMFVGHEPSFSEVVGDLTGADVVMKKGGLARVDVDAYSQPLAGVLAWLIPPKVFEALEKEED